MNNIRYLRQKNNLTQMELAAKVGVNQTTVSAWENGKQGMELAAAIKMATMFEVSLDYLLGLSTD